MHIRNTMCIILLAIAISIILSCAATVNPDIKLHKDASAKELKLGNLQSALSHMDYAEAACDNPPCREEVLHWMIGLGAQQNNDVFRAKAYEKLALHHLERYLAGQTDGLVSAKTVANEFYLWADSLKKGRGDLFPLPDAMILAASLHLFDRPDSSVYLIAEVMKIGVELKQDAIPTQLKIAIGRGKALIDELSNKMNENFEQGKEKIISSDPEAGIDELVYAYRASAALGKTELAANSAVLLAEYYAGIGKGDIAGQWTSAALRWKGESIHGKSHAE